MAKNWFCRITKIQSYIKGKIRQEELLRAKQSSIVTIFPDSIKNDITRFLTEKLNKAIFDVPTVNQNKKPKGLSNEAIKS